MQVSIDITDKQLASLLVSALEDGSLYWIHRFSHKGETDAKPFGEEYTPKYIAAPFSKGGHLEISVLEEPGESIKYLDRAAMERGLQLMATEYPYHFANVLTQDADAETGDVFLQLSVLGALVYG